MSDLIDRRELLKKFMYDYDGRRIHEYDIDNFPVTVSISQIKTMIREMPTAFDLDKVIAELEKMIRPNVDSETGIPCDNWVVDMQNETIKKCIETVQKFGGRCR